MNRSLRIEYPSTLPDALYQTPSEFEQDPRLAMAVKLFGNEAHFLWTDCPGGRNGSHNIPVAARGERPHHDQPAGDSDIGGRL
jgi:hypothetical protein